MKNIKSMKLYKVYKNISLFDVFKSKSICVPIEKIEVHRPSVGKSQLYPSDDLVIALASDELIPECPLPFFDLEDVAGIAAFILVQTKLKQAS